MSKDGLDDFLDSLNNLQSSFEKVQGKHDVAVEDLFTDEFIQTHTKFDTFSDFWESANITSKSLNEVPSDQIDPFITENTNFSDFDEMLSVATTDWTRRQVGF